MIALTRFMFLTALVFAHTGSHAASLVECAGDSKSTKTAIYLHGLDSLKVGRQEEQNREIMRALAKKLSYKIAILRSSEVCKGEKACWPHEPRSTHGAQWDIIRKAAASCVGSGDVDTVIGFSNGGYFAAKLARYCLPGVKHVIAIGSAGKLESTDSPSAHCAGLTQLIGHRDLSRAKTEAYHKMMLDKKYKADLQVFTGAHEIKEKVLREALEKSAQGS